MKRYIKSSDESIFASSFNSARKRLNEQPCAFLTAFRYTYTNNENRKRNKQLESDIKSAGLSFIKVGGGYIENKGTESEHPVTEDSFCIIDNGQYDSYDFTKLMISFCKKYDQDSVLITQPDEGGKGDEAYRKLISVTARLYDKNGNIIDIFKNASMHNIEDYFTRIHGKDFVFSEYEVNMEEDGYDMYNWLSGLAMHANFKKKYQELYEE